MPRGRSRHRILEVIDVVHFNVQNDRDVGAEAQERIHIFARLEDEVLLTADAVCAAEFRHNRAAEDRGVASREIQRGGAHGRAGALSVHTGDADAASVSRHDVAEIIGAGDAGHSESKRGFIFGIFRRNCYGVDNCLIADEVSLLVRVEHLDSHGLKLLCDRSIGSVGAADAVAAELRNLGKRGHIDPADADEINAPDTFEHLRDALGSEICVGC